MTEKRDNSSDNTGFKYKVISKKADSKIKPWTSEFLVMHLNQAKFADYPGTCEGLCEYYSSIDLTYRYEPIYDPDPRQGEFNFND